MINSNFLSECAQSLFEKYGYAISDINIVMPTRRAASFLKLEIASLIKDRPIWQPKFCSINSLMAKVTDLREAERIKLITELYKIYNRYHNESFDKFYYWGGVILSDFDTIDNYMVDAKTIYSNISDIKEIEERFDYLTHEQKDMILRFWSNFKGGKAHSESQQEFLKIWNTLHPIYTEFRAALASQGIGYGGMIYRLAAEKIAKSKKIEDIDGKKYAVVGFNALSKCETTLFDHLKEQCDADFFWDYDNYYIDNRRQEAGLFIRSNINRYGESCCEDYDRSLFEKSKEITIVNSPSESLSLKFCGKILEEFAAKNGGILSRETAIILTNESLLVPLLYSMPECVDNMNVTSGYPLHLTSAYSLINTLIKLYQSVDNRDGKIFFYHKELFKLISNYYIQSTLTPEEREFYENLKTTSIKELNSYIDSDLLLKDEFSSMLFSIPTNIYSVCDKLEAILREIANLCVSVFSDEELEYINTAMEIIIKLRNSIEGCDDILTISVFYSMIDKYLKSSSVTFEGEPLLGMQIMGILESRNLDFKNVIILSLSEDNYPSINTLNSLIPSNLRLGYNLPTIANHEAMYSYYFYRLLQRAENAYLIYSSYSGESLSGEMSRYLYQLLLESPHRDSIIKTEIGLNVVSPSRNDIVVKKEGEVSEKLERYLLGSRSLSASRLFDYIECPLRFYFSSIENIRPAEVIEEDISAATSGTILHKILEDIYCEVKNEKKEVKKVLSEIVGGGKYDIFIDNAFKKILNIDTLEFDGRINSKKIEIKHLAQGIINYDIASNQNFRVSGTEFIFQESLEFDKGKSVTFKGVVDRIDTLSDGTVRIIDYKSGKSNHSCKSLEEAMSIDSEKASKPIFQTLLYSLLYKKMKGVNVRPALYHARDIANSGYQELLTIDKSPLENFSEVEEQFVTLLEQLLIGLFDKNQSFYQTENKESCKYCNFNNICFKGEQ